MRAKTEKSQKTGTKKTPPQSLQDIVKDLRFRIANHIIPPAARLREQEMSNELGISRAHARDVLDTLVSLGFAERAPNKGVAVIRFDKTAILKLFDVREINEGLCARLAAQNSSAEDWKELTQLFGKPLDKILSNTSLDEYEKLYDMLRLRLMEKSDNQYLCDIIQQIYEKTHIYTRRLVMISNRMAEAASEHRALLTALSQGNAKEAERIRRNTIANLRSVFDKHSSFIL